MNQALSAAARPTGRTRPAREATPDPAREFGFTRQDFKRASSLIYQRAGIVLNESKQDMVYSRLARRLRELRLDSVGLYLDRLESTGDEMEWQSFTNALTTNLTAFFREAHHFDILKQHLASLPPKSRHLIWCAAASTGEEPYSLAMSAVEHYGSLTPPVAILATDIDTQVLDTAQQGVYPLERIEKLERERVRKFFRKGSGDQEGYCCVRDELRKLITFRPLNLLDTLYGLRGPFDALFCRNVMIYFDKDTQRSILQKMAPLMSADSLFFAGHSESLFHASDLLTSIGKTVYKKA